MLATSLCLAMVDTDEQREAWGDVAPAEDEDMESTVDTEDEVCLDKSGVMMRFTHIHNSSCGHIPEC